MTVIRLMPLGNMKISLAKEAFTNALIGVTITLLVSPDDIESIEDQIIRESARRVYQEAVVAVREHEMKPAPTVIGFGTAPLDLTVEQDSRKEVMPSENANPTRGRKRESNATLPRELLKLAGHSDSSWQPIETAPKSRDEKIDLWLVDRKTENEWREPDCWWSNGWTALRNSLTGIWICGRHCLDEHDKPSYDQHCVDDQSIVATHWRRVPAGPNLEFV